MIKMATSANGQTVLALAFTRAEVDRMLAGGAFTVDLMGPRGKQGVVIVTAGEDNDALERTVRDIAKEHPGPVRFEVQR